MDFSFIIVTYNSEKFIHRCLVSIETKLIDNHETFDLKQTRTSEIFLVDNASGDHTLEIIRSHHPKVSLFTNEKNLGFAHACNQAIERTSGELICLVNPDSEILNGDLIKVKEFFSQNLDAGIIGAKLLNPDGSFQPGCRIIPTLPSLLFSRKSFISKLLPGNPLSKKYIYSGTNPDTIQEVDSVAGASMFIRRRILDRIGRFDPQFFLYVEDTDICLRAWKAGFRVYYFPHIQFLHHWGGSTAWSLKSRFYHYKSMFRFFKKHGMFSKHPYLPSNHPPVSSI